jgi:4-hydroxybenzoate polyprenyltransferase
MNTLRALSPRERLHQYARLIRLDRPVGSFLLLWPTLWALWLAAKGMPDLKILGIFVLGVFLMRSAGCAINDYADRDVDPFVERTRDRPLAAKWITPVEALMVFGILALIALALVFALNPLTRWMSLIGALLTISYPFMKRFHYLPQVHLGTAFAWAIPMAYTAQTGELPPVSGWLLFLVSIVWTTAYDTMYAMADREDDLRVGVKSTAILFGDADRMVIGILQMMFLFGMYLLGKEMKLGWPYFTGLGIASVLALFQQFLIRLREPQDCIRAFRNNNWLGLWIFLGLVMSYWLGYGANRS